MGHNKFIGFESLIGAMERLQKISPWLSRQIIQRTAEWPFWYSGLQIRDWRDGQVHVHMPLSRRNSVDGEICHGHLLLGGELTLRLLLLRYRQEFPFSYRWVASRLDVHHSLDQDVDYKFGMDPGEWERLRLELARDSRAQSEFVFPAYLADGRVAASVTFQAAFQLEKFLPA